VSSSSARSPRPRPSSARPLNSEGGFGEWGVASGHAEARRMETVSQSMRASGQIPGLLIYMYIQIYTGERVGFADAERSEAAEKNGGRGGEGGGSVSVRLTTQYGPPHTRLKQGVKRVLRSLLTQNTLSEAPKGDQAPPLCPTEGACLRKPEHNSRSKRYV
jgi:hypothetical protein